MTTTQSPGATGQRSHRAVKWAILLLPLLLVLPVIVLLHNYQFDGLYGQDAYAYYRYATGPLRDSLLALRPPPPFYWPPGYPILVALLSLLLGVSPLSGQVASLIAGALVPLFTALLAWELWPDDEGRQRVWIALLAGLFVALMPQMWQSSTVVMADTAALAASTLGAWALVRYGRGASGSWLFLAAAALALAILARWAHALVALPCTIYALVALARRPRRAALTQAAAAAAIVLVILFPIVFSAVQGGSLPGSERTSFIGNVQVVTWSPLNALQNTFAGSDGQLSYRLPNGLYYALLPAHRYYFTPLLALFLLPGLWLLWQRRTAARLLLLVAWPAIVYVFLAGIPWQNFRFALTYLPPMAILAARGVVAIVRAPGRARRLPLLLVVVALPWMAAGGWTLGKSFIVRKQASLSTVHWVEAQVESEARLFTFGITLALEHYGDVEVYDVFLLTPEQMQALLQDDRPSYLLLDVENVETQWAGRAPSQNYHWLRQEVGLTPLGQREPYSLFRVDQGGDRDPP